MASSSQMQSSPSVDDCSSSCRSRNPNSPKKVVHCRVTEVKNTLIDTDFPSLGVRDGEGYSIRLPLDAESVATVRPRKSQPHVPHFFFFYRDVFVQLGTYILSIITTTDIVCCFYAGRPMGRPEFLEAFDEGAAAETAINPAQALAPSLADEPTVSGGAPIPEGADLPKVTAERDQAQQELEITRAEKEKARTDLAALNKRFVTAVEHIAIL
ncbi:hypothetical protein K1719_008221 [Acacia pycnantha]|nr:hypothetical protein K1719_008221 [Acacia pycnantha]